MRFNPTCQAITSSTSVVADCASPTITSSPPDNSSPARIHGRRVRVRSLSIPTAILAMLATTAPEKVTCASSATSSPPCNSAMRWGRSTVSSGT